MIRGRPRTGSPGRGPGLDAGLAPLLLAVGAAATGCAEQGPGAVEGVAGSPESVSSDPGAPLRERLERWEHGDVGARMVRSLEQLLADPAAGDPMTYLPVQRGWVTAKMAGSFLSANPGLVPEDWSLRRVEAYPLGSNGPIQTTVLDLHRQLAEAGVELIVVPVPSRLNVEPDLLEGISADEARGGFAPGLTRWMLDLAEAGVTVVDLVEPLAAAHSSGEFAPGQVFLEINNHWGPDGVAAAAEAVAARLRERPWYPGPAGSGSGLESTSVDAWSHPIQALPDDAGPVDLTLARVVGPDGAVIAAGDRSSPVVLLGDSFATIFEAQGADFPRHLQHHLDLPLDVIAMPGGGGRGVWVSFARRREPLAGKRAVVWLFTVWALRRIGPEPVQVVR